MKQKTTTSVVINSQNNRTQNNHNMRYKTALSKDLPELFDWIQVDTGDILLYDRKCKTMSFNGAILCTLAKIASKSQWDHVVSVLQFFLKIYIYICVCVFVFVLQRYNISFQF